MSLDRAGTETEAANLALGHLGQPAIADISDVGLRARTMRRFFAAARDSTMREKWWKFGKTFVRPSADPVKSLGSIKTRYAMPADCLRVCYLDDGRGGVFTLDQGKWDLEGGAIDVAGAQIESEFLVTDIGSPTVCYVRRVETVRLWDPVFLMGFSFRLASLSARMLGRSSAKAASLEVQAREEIEKAAQFDAKEATVKRAQPVPSYLSCAAGSPRTRFGR
jgi:hypothetical protein